MAVSKKSRKLLLDLSARIAPLLIKKGFKLEYGIEYLASLPIDLALDFENRDLVWVEDFDGEMHSFETVATAFEFCKTTINKCIL